MDECNLSGLISAAVLAKMTPAFIEKEVETRVSKLIEESVDRALRSYSDTGRLIEKAVEECLRVGDLNLPSYGETVAAILKTQIEATVAPLVAGRLADDMNALLHLAPKEVKLSEIATIMRDRHDGDAYGEIITVIVERTDYGSAHIYLDEDNGEVEKYRCPHSVFVGKDGKISSATLRGNDMKSVRHLGSGYGLDQLIRAWFACGTTIILDEDSVVVSVGDYG
jgi:hypothetical protein